MRSISAWLVLGSLLGVVAVGCGGGNDTPDSGTTMDTGAVDAPSTTPDANRDAYRPTGDSFANYTDAITGARTQECECTWMDDGFKTRAACVDDQLTNGDLLTCAEEGYNAARSASAAHYDCVSPALATYASCRMTAGCDNADAVTACVDAVNAALQACPDLPEEAQTATSACFEREVIGPASTCPEATAWMGLGTFTGDTTLAGNDTNPDASCFADGMIPDTLEISPDRAYRWVAPSAGTFLIDTVGSEFDTILYVRSDCAAGTNVACSDDIDTAGGMYTSRVSVTATAAGQEFIVIVDGFAAQSHGAFTVNVTMGASPDAGMSSMPDAGVSDAGVSDDAAVIADDAFAG